MNNKETGKIHLSNRTMKKIQKAIKMTFLNF